MTLIRDLPLRRKLPLLVTGLTAGALLASGTLAYLAVRRSALTAAEARLSSIVSELESLTTANQAERGEMERGLAASPVVRATLEGAPVDTARLIALLNTLRSDAEEGLPIQLVRADASVAFSIGSISPPDPDPDPPLGVAREYGPLRSVGGLSLYWTTIPVPGADGHPLGWIAQRRGLGNPDTGSTLALLLGSGIRVLLGTLSDSAWADVGGSIVGMQPDQVRLGGLYRSRTRAGEETLATARLLSRSPWVVQVDIPMAQVMARPRAFLRVALAVGSLLTALTVLLAWRAGRRLAKPLTELSAAADAIATGDYGKRVAVESNDEVGRLARAFNTMSRQVEESNEALHLRLGEARALALRLEEANHVAEDAREEAQRASRAKSEFLATISHEIRTPISAVVSYIDLLASGVPHEPTKEQRRYLERIEGVNEHLIALTNDLLDFSQMESGQMRLEMEPVSVHEVVSVALATLEPQATARGVCLAQEGCDGLRLVGDVQRVRQIVLNLVSNAIRYMPGGGSVTVRGTRSAEGPPGMDRPSDGGWGCICVQDDGIGIEPGQLARMFEPFVQGPAAPDDTHDGVGLGLAISRRLASLMSGALTAESTPGKGSTFTLWLATPPVAEGVSRTSAEDERGA